MSGSAGITSPSEQYENSTVTIAGNTITATCSGIVTCGYVINSTMTIASNTIEAERGIRLRYDIEDSTVDIIANTIFITDNRVGTGICEEILNSTVTIADNIINADETTPGCVGVSIDDIYRGSTVVVQGNIITNFDYGIYIDEVDYPDDPIMVQIDDNVIEGCDYGLYIYDISDGVSTVSVTIIGNQFVDNGVALTFSKTMDIGSDLVISENKFDGNGMGLNNGTASEVDATENWWGDATGPYHPTDNSDGLGDEVSDDVLFDPWYIDETMAQLSSP